MFDFALVAITCLRYRIFTLASASSDVITFCQHKVEVAFVRVNAGTGPAR